MTVSISSSGAAVYRGYFADPFVWEDQGVYYAIGTGAREASGQTVGKVFPLLQSADLANWHYVGGALVPPPGELGDTFWAPAVARHNGAFYLYYSVGHADSAHQLRVAHGAQPQGPYEDMGRPLLDYRVTPFAIDPHPFRNDDGQWYLFFARDFLDCSGRARAGTALVARRMRSMSELEDEESVVLRARADWQRFRANRRMYGANWDWHTLEGPCLVQHENRYYCFYSGGCWENDSYGVDYGVADSVLGPYSDEGNEAGPRVLRTIPKELIGPGHNSWFKGPDGSEYLAYHAWDEERSARQMYISRLVWTPEGPRCALK